MIIEVMLCQSFLERLDQANQINRLAGEQAGDNGDRLGEAEIGQVDCGELDARIKLIRPHVADVHPFHADDTRIVGNAAAQLAITGIDRVDQPSAALKHAVRESAGRSAGVEANSSRHANAEAPGHLRGNYVGFRVARTLTPNRRADIGITALRSCPPELRE